MLTPHVSVTMGSTYTGERNASETQSEEGRKIIQQQLQSIIASAAVAAESVRERERRRVCVYVFLCTVPGVAEPCCRVAGCVLLLCSRALW